jgi:putative glutamine amidotransferase
MRSNHTIIGISKSSDNYVNWLLAFNPHLKFIDFYTLEQAEVMDCFKQINGLLLPGGGDLNPGLYGMGNKRELCNGMDDKRDELEIKLIERAFLYKIPLLAICRGQQILNVARGGTLIPDIPSLMAHALEHKAAADVEHWVTLNTGSELHNITHQQRAIVNSAHHQAIDKLASGFNLTASGSDGIIEAIEADNDIYPSFCIAVQWHPERMRTDHPMSGPIGRRFIEEAENWDG